MRGYSPLQEFFTLLLAQADLDLGWHTQGTKPHPCFDPSSPSWEDHFPVFIFSMNTAKEGAMLLLEAGCSIVEQDRRETSVA